MWQPWVNKKVDSLVSVYCCECLVCRECLWTPGVSWHCQLSSFKDATCVVSGVTLGTLALASRRIHKAYLDIFSHCLFGQQSTGLLKFEMPYAILTLLSRKIFDPIYNLCFPLYICTFPIHGDCRQTKPLNWDLDNNIVRTQPNCQNRVHGRSFSHRISRGHEEGKPFLTVLFG